LYEAQALVLVNYGGATATEILSFVELVTKKVREVTGIVIEPEVRFVGDES
jgi:UDP-N-acetylmuramate dehydrogenase